MIRLRPKKIAILKAVLNTLLIFTGTPRHIRDYISFVKKYYTADGGPLLEK